MGNRTWWRLAALMALAYAVQGAWWPVLAVHLQDLGISGRWRGAIFATQAIASLITPLWAGQVADRRIAAPRLLAAIYAAGSFLLAAAAWGMATSAVALFGLFLAYWLITAPATGLCNAVVLRNLERPAEQFGGVRLWGTAGWMAAGWASWACLAPGGSASPALGTGTGPAFAIAVAFSAVLAVSCLALPPTPPLALGTRGRVFAEALEVFRRPGVAVVILAAFGVSLTTPFIYQGVGGFLRSAGMPNHQIAAAMTLGQMTEIAGLLALPGVLRRLGPKRTMAVGIASWVLYHAIFAVGFPLPLVVAAIGLNGPAIAFFHIAGPMYIDSQAPADRRAGAQSLWLFASTGMGNLLGNILAGEVIEATSGAWRVVFSVAALIDIIVLIGFLATFRPRPGGASKIAIPRLTNPDQSRPPTIAWSINPRKIWPTL